jgi:hypothetical protein
MGEKAATMTIDAINTQPTMQENTFFGNTQLNGVMAHLNSDLNQQAAPSAGTSGSSSLLTQSLRPQDQTGGDCGDLHITVGAGSLLQGSAKLLQQCSCQQAAVTAATTKVTKDCGTNCPQSGPGRLWNELPTLLGADGKCKPCNTDLDDRADKQQDLDDCQSLVIQSAKDAAKNGAQEALKHQEASFYTCVAMGGRLWECCTNSGGEWIDAYPQVGCQYTLPDGTKVLYTDAPSHGPSGGGGNCAAWSNLCS